MRRVDLKGGVLISKFLEPWTISPCWDFKIISNLNKTLLFIFEILLFSLLLDKCQDSLNFSFYNKKTYVLTKINFYRKWLIGNFNCQIWSQLFKIIILSANSNFLLHLTRCFRLRVLIFWRHQGYIRGTLDPDVA